MADDVDGTAEVEPQGDQLLDTPATTPDTSGQPESFINPADLPPQLKEIYSRMHRSYVKAIDKSKGALAKAQQVDRFWDDPEFAKQSIQEWATRTGTPISFGGPAAAPTTAPSTQGGPPAEFVAAIESELPPELRWMARPLAASQWKAQAAIVAPMIRETRQKEATQRSNEYETLAGELTETAPGWEEHEDEMTDLLGFLQGPDLRSRRWGNKLQLLHNLVTGNASATRAAVRQIGDAARNRTSVSLPGRSTAPNIADRVRSARSMQDSVDLALSHAEEEMRRQGIALPYKG